MKFIFYLFIINQIIVNFDVLADKVKKKTSPYNPIKWEKIKENNSNTLKKVIWKSYGEDESYFGEEKSNIKSIYKDINFRKEKTNIKSIYKDINFKKEKNRLSNKQKAKKELLQIQPHIPLNNFLDFGHFTFSSTWKSAFSGGAGGGIGNQNISLKFDYGLSDDSLLSLYFSESDDPLFNLIDGDLIPNYWASFALAYKQKVFESENLKNSLSFAVSLEYWNVSSGSNEENAKKKSIYNQLDNVAGHDKHEKFIYSVSFPFTHDLNKETKLSLIPGATFLPDKLGNKNIGRNFYGSNYFLSTGIQSDILQNIQLLGSFTYLLGPGFNSFNQDLEFNRNSIYSYGIYWDVNSIIGIEGKITNGYGTTPSTSLLTIPSDNKPLYYLGGVYRPFGKENRFVPLEKNIRQLLFGGLTVNNALVPERGASQISFNYDEKGNLFSFYGYSLSKMFQLEVLNIGSFNNLNLRGDENLNLYSTYLGEDNLNFRLGGKLLIFSPQKDDLFWVTLRSSVGRNFETNKGYLFSELINTFRVNDWLVFNISPKYFFSGVESFGGLGFSSYINLLDNLQLIPEINTLIKNDSDLNYSLALRYSFSHKKSLDLYYSNAAGVQDIGQLLKDKEYRLGIKFNYLL